MPGISVEPNLPTPLVILLLQSYSHNACRRTPSGRPAGSNTKYEGYTMKLRHVACAAVFAGTVLGTGGSALAGERAGNGNWTPINSDNDSVSDASPNNSICAFSGLEDDNNLGGPGQVQTPHGETAFDIVFPPGVASICQYLNNGNNPKPPPPSPE